MANTSDANADQQHAGLVSAVYFLVEKPINDLALVKWFAIIVFVGAILVIIQGFLGGRLVYKYHYGIEPRHQQAA